MNGDAVCQGNIEGIGLEERLILSLRFLYVIKAERNSDQFFIGV